MSCILTFCALFTTLFFAFFRNLLFGTGGALYYNAYTDSVRNSRAWLVHDTDIELAKNALNALNEHTCVPREVTTTQPDYGQLNYDFVRYQFLNVGIDEGHNPFIHFFRFNAYSSLIWVLCWTWLFQFFRYKYNIVENKQRVHPDESKEIGGTHTELERLTKPHEKKQEEKENHLKDESFCCFRFCCFRWFRFLRLIFLSGHVNYDPNKSDYGRWLEYAFTSPQQIILVSTQVGIDDYRHVWALAFLQMAIVMQGYMVELCMDTIWQLGLRKCGIQNDDDTPIIVTTTPPTIVLRVGVSQTPSTTSEKSGEAGIKSKAEVSKIDEEITSQRIILWSILAGVWTQHIFLWVTLITSFSQISSEFRECHKEEYPDAKVPGFVIWLLVVQFLCFSSFGVVQSCQCYRQYQITKNGVDGEEELDEDYIHTEWYKVTRYYSILSVTAKLSLDVIYISGTTVMAS